MIAETVNNASPDWVCVECGHRQTYPGACPHCGEPDLHDLRKRETWLYLQDVETRTNSRRSGRLIWVAVLSAIVVIGGLWFIPGFWILRARSFALPFLLDQILAMGALAGGLTLLLEKLLKKPSKFPFLSDLWPKE
jgi:hypothetical protein